MEERGGGVPLPYVDVNPWVDGKYGPLNLPNNLYDLRESYLNILPKYDGERDTIAEEHMATRQEFICNIYKEHDDVFMMLFFQTLECEVRTCFRDLPKNYLNS